MKPPPPPGLPTWLFILTDLALISAAAVIAWTGPSPLTPGAMYAIVACVGLGALAGLVPLVLRQERLKNEALDVRQRALEALAATVQESAQQVSIATGSLNGIAELARRTLREAEDLPARLRERMAEFQGRMAEADQTAKPLLEEHAARRKREEERLETAAAQLGRAAADLARLEAAWNTRVAELRARTDEAVARIREAHEQAFAAGIADRVRAARATAAPPPPPAIPEPPAAEAAVPAPEPLPVPPAPVPEPVALPAAPAAETPAEAPAADGTAPAPRRPRRPRRETAVATPVPTPPPETAVAAVSPEPPAPPAAPATAAEASPPPPAAAVADPLPASPAPQKRAPRRAEPEPEPALSLGFDEPAAPGGGERTLTSDGATRLLVTAYIGIGNRLFLRGDGPGLAWDRGVPLHFVSIGKWRWETAEATAPIRFKVFKNDEQECVKLGEQTLDPGYLQEVTANF